LLQVLDVATKEQAESQKHETPNLEEENGEEATESSENVPPDEEEEKVEAVDTPVQKSEKTESKKNKGDKKQHPEGTSNVLSVVALVLLIFCLGDILEEIQEVDVDGDIVETIDVPRGMDTSYHTLYEELKNMSAVRLTNEEMTSLRSEVEKQLSAWTEVRL
jgi:hypothetical protein